MSAETFALRSKALERQKRVQGVQHVVAAVLLITTAWSHLTSPHAHSIVLPVLEILTALGVIGMGIADRYRKHHARFGWFELAGSAMLFVEAFAKLDERHHRSFYVLQFIPPVILLLFGLFEGRIREGVRLEANDDHFLIRTRALRSRRVKWDGLRSYRIAGDLIELIAADGRTKKIKLEDVYEPAAAAAWAEEQFRRRGLTPVETPPASSGG